MLTLEDLVALCFCTYLRTFFMVLREEICSKMVAFCS